MIGKLRMKLIAASMLSLLAVLLCIEGVIGGINYKKIVEDMISACRRHVVAATGPSPFKVRDNQRPERTMSGVAKTFA